MENRCTWNEVVRGILSFDNIMHFNAMKFLYEQADFYRKAVSLAGNNIVEYIWSYYVPEFKIKDFPSKDKLFLGDISLKAIIDNENYDILLKATDKKEHKINLEKWKKKLSLKQLQDECKRIYFILKKYKLFLAINWTDVNSVDGNNHERQPFGCYFLDQASIIDIQPESIKQKNINSDKLFSLLVKRHPNVICMCFLKQTYNINFTPLTLEKMAQKFAKIIQAREEKFPVRNLTIELAGASSKEKTRTLFQVFFDSNKLKLDSFSLLCRCESDDAWGFSSIVVHKYPENFGLEAGKLLEYHRETLKEIKLQLCFAETQQYKELFAGVVKCEKLRRFSLMIDFAQPESKEIILLVIEELWDCLDNLKHKLDKFKIIFKQEDANFDFMKYIVENKKYFNVRNLHYNFMFYYNNNKFLGYYLDFLNLFSNVQSKVENLHMFPEGQSKKQHDKSTISCKNFGGFFSGKSFGECKIISNFPAKDYTRINRFSLETPSCVSLIYNQPNQPNQFDSTCAPCNKVYMRTSSLIYD